MRALFAAGPAVIFISMVVGSLVALMMPVAWEGVRDEYDRSHPVWVAESAKVTQREGDSVTIAIVGNKVRDCDLLRTWAQTLYTDRPSADAAVQRTGGRSIGYIIRPVGRQDLGELVVSPVPADAVAVVIHVQHSCHGRTVPSILGRVELGP